MAHYGFLDLTDEDALHAPRLLNFEEKNFKRLIKHISEISITLSRPRDVEGDESHENPPQGTPVPEHVEDDKAAERRAWMDEILLDFANFDSNIIRAQLILNSNQQERVRYAAEKTRIEGTARAVKHNNAALQEQLKEARRTLEIRKGWDKMAEKITSNKALRSRDEQRVQLEKLNAEIAELHAESQEYARTWVERREQFGKIVDEGTQLLRLIRDEKEEAERKEGMDDIDDEGAATPTRVDRSRAATPAGATTPIHQSPHQASKLRDEVVTSEHSMPPVSSEESEDTDAQMAGQAANSET